MVTQCKGAVGDDRTKGLDEIVVRVRTLFQASGREYNVSAKVWKLHGNNEVLWTVSRIKVGVDAGVVRDTPYTNVKAVWVL